MLFPLFLFIYILLKLSNNGSAFICQERIGYRAQPFYIYKFRTMVMNAEKEGVPQLASKDDSRLTNIGKFLRTYHLDELPQFWNVLKGDMSLVGPRPERKYFIDKIMEVNSDYQYIYAMRPGLTSRATLENGYTDTMDKMLRRLEMDLDYLRNRSLLLDIKIILRTMCSCISGKKF